MVIGFIGLGNMAGAMIGGILKQGEITKENIIGADASASAAEAAASKFGIKKMDSNTAVAANCDILVLSVKPQFYEAVITEIKDEVSDEQLIVTIAPGKTLAWLGERLGDGRKIIRCMPNTPALVGEGCTALCGNSHVTDQEMEQALHIISSFGIARIVQENLMDVVVGISGSSPAYVFMFIEAMADAAVAEGMPRKMAYEFAAQAVLGSAKLVLETGKHPGELKDMVCSPAGTTIQAVKTLEAEGMRSAVMEAVQVCIDKSRSL